MLQTPIELEGQPARPPVHSPTGLLLQGWQKGLLLVVALGFLYLRIWSKKRKHERICPHCGERSPGHLGNCRKCSAPLFRES
jgi:ribosomal protein L40E